MVGIKATSNTPGVVGRRLAPFDVHVERDLLRLFCELTGFQSAVYHDVAGARQAGYPDLLVPPTYLFSLELRRPDPYGIVRELGLDVSRLLHGGQEFRYQAPCFAGDLLHFEPRIVEHYDKRGGALVFLVRETEVTRAGQSVATLRNTAIIQTGATP
ncbi:MaoC family dehydratase N-terminal domain-containing protein [Dactylosporangium fulvum]|uniref:MaoC family dehydratase N-terminal domain-containing protein n=1 Tax=Dactylosporangium fulvum TaxID=53359 RepID=A0ABY5VRQ3_9ACTN|nr:MaoC family dehydratase N-terminal domain-containing protein [Dactylosporangium fulvum]UWP79761.1 MaoC family dehydratase N-terminal domain-containing protein [Dactylosporangium fulvum]